jgi:hypothetical protein
MRRLVTYDLHKWATRIRCPLSCGGLALKLPTHAHRTLLALLHDVVTFLAFIYPRRVRPLKWLLPRKMPNDVRENRKPL